MEVCQADIWSNQSEEANPSQIEPVLNSSFIPSSLLGYMLCCSNIGIGLDRTLLV